MQKKGKKKLWKRLSAVGISLMLFFALFLGIAQLGVIVADKTWEHWRPTYEKEDITALLLQAERSDADYRKLYEQTGLTKLGIDDLLENGNISEILRIQQGFFAEYEEVEEYFGPFTYIEETDGYMPITTALEDGDVLVSATTRVSWFRYGHAALVVDAKNRYIAEAVSVGVESWLAGVHTFSDLANFIVLRPNVEESVRKEVAEYARKNLIGIPYRLTTGIFSKKFDPDKITGSQCAHLVWYAYKKFGYDLDSTGGAVVKPQDMANSEYMQVVQVFGFDPDKLWS